jgi:hypothetical protein
MARKSNDKCHGINIGYFAGRYAEELMHNARFHVSSLPQLLGDEKYKKLSAYQREEVMHNIRLAAKDLFYEAGYAWDLVDRIFQYNK